MKANPNGEDDDDDDDDEDEDEDEEYDSAPAGMMSTSRSHHMPSVGGPLLTLGGQRQQPVQLASAGGSGGAAAAPNPTTAAATATANKSKKAATNELAAMLSATGEDAMLVEDLAVHLQNHKQQASEVGEEGDLPLHAYLKSGGQCDPGAVEMLLDAHPAAASTKSGGQMLPLHLYLTSCAQHNVEAEPEVVSTLLEYYRGGASETFNKNLPLHAHLERNSHATIDVVEILADAYPEALRLPGDAGACPLVTCKVTHTA